MLFIILSLLIYVALIAISTNILTSLSVPIFLMILYVLPIAINLSLIYIQKKDKAKLLFSLFLPTLSMGFYILFALFTSTSGSWLEFVQMNTLEEADISVNIAENLFSMGQLAFAALSYYASAIGVYVLTKVVNKEDKGLSYA